MSRVIVTPFKVSGKGNIQGKLHEGVLMPNNPLVIMDESGTIINYSSTVIPGIEVIGVKYEKGIFYNYTIEVTGGCPKGYATMNMEFVDETNDVYHLNITSSSVYKHTVNYNSVKPNLKEIRWNIIG